MGNYSIQFKKSSKHPKVSILLVTYNHEKYISEALDCILIQNVDFNYEVIVADDFSTDHTLEIVEKYRDKRPDIFFILNLVKNVGITKNYQRGFKACSGEYIAVLEGDDYWTSPFKLKKQVEFLDNHRECVLTFNRFVVFDMDSKRQNVQPWPVNDDFQYIMVTDLVKDNFIGNFSTCVYRTDVIKKIDDSLYDLTVYDWMLNIVVAQQGLIGYIPDVMSVYRLHSAGTWTQKSQNEKIQDTINLMEVYDKYLEYKYTAEFSEHKNRLSAMLHPVDAVVEQRKVLFKHKIQNYIPPIIIMLLKLLLPPKIKNIISK